jgi:hypothetical protein
MLLGNCYFFDVGKSQSQNLFSDKDAECRVSLLDKLNEVKNKSSETEKRPNTIITFAFE